MKPMLFYRIASVLLVLFAAGHQIGFRQTKGMTGADAVVEQMKSVHFTVQGFPRVYYDFFVGFGYFVTVFLLFSAVLAWQLGGLQPDVLVRIPVVTWGLAACFAAVAILSWTYFFAAPGVFATLVTICLAAGACLAGRG
jgi:hypothetical protein